MTNVLSPWNPEENRTQARLTVGAMLGEVALTAIGVTVAAFAGHAEVVPLVVAGGASSVVATGVTAIVAARG